MAKTLFGCLVMAMLGVTGYFLVADTRDPASVGIPNVTETHRSCSNGKKCCSEATDCTAAKDETKCCDSKDGKCCSADKKDDAKCCDSKDGKCCSGEKKDDAKCCEGKGECKGEKCSGEKKDDAKCCEGKGECKGEKCTGEKKE